MAKLVGILNMGHGPFITTAPEKWQVIRDGRPAFRADVPVETIEEATAKFERQLAALAVLGGKLQEMKPDVILMFSKCEDFDFNNYPLLSVYVGETFAGPDSTGLSHLVQNHRPLAVHLLRSLISSGFAPAFSLGLQHEEKGMGHGVMRPLEFFDTYNLPVVPLISNSFNPPELPASRFYEIGRVARAAIDSYPEDLRVVAMGSGGLWHTPGRVDAYINEEFDRTMLSYLEKGDIAGSVKYFDSYQIPEGDRSQVWLPDVTGMAGFDTPGPQMGARDICQWIAASAVAEGRPQTIVDYIPVYSSPIGTAFSYCDDI